MFDDNMITFDDNQRLIVWHENFTRIGRELQFSVLIEWFELSFIYGAQNIPSVSPFA